MDGGLADLGGLELGDGLVAQGGELLSSVVSPLLLLPRRVGLDLRWRPGARLGLRLQDDRVDVEVVVARPVQVLLIGAGEVAKPGLGDLQNARGEGADERSSSC